MAIQQAHETEKESGVVDGKKSELKTTTEPRNISKWNKLKIFMFKLYPFFLP